MTSAGYDVIFHKRGLVENENLEVDLFIPALKTAIESPLRTIVSNAGGEGSVVVNKVKEGKGDFGYNARNDVYENLIASGVIDPVKVTRLALENSASISGLLLTTEVAITDKPEENPEPTPPMNPGMMM